MGEQKAKEVDWTEVSEPARRVLEDWDALGVEEFDGELLLPTTIKKRSKSGALVGVEVMLKKPSFRQRTIARTRSRETAAKVYKLDLEKDKDLLDEIENFEMLAFGIRDKKPPHDQHVFDAQALLSTYETPSLSEAWGLLDKWADMLDPRYGEMTGEQLWEVIQEIGAKQNIAPLVGMRGFEQVTCIMLMAAEALLSPNAPSSVRSSETSTSER